MSCQLVVPEPFVDKAYPEVPSFGGRTNCGLPLKLLCGGAFIVTLCALLTSQNKSIDATFPVPVRIPILPVSYTHLTLPTSDLV